MRVLVTGCAGRIGSEATRLLRSAGHEVVGIDLVEPATVVPDEFFHGAITSFETTHAVFNNVEAAIHLGAFMSWNPDDSADVFEAGAATTFHLLHALSAGGLRRFVFASTGDVYPESVPSYLPIDEHHPRLPRSIYGLTKSLGESMVDFFSRTTSLPGVVLRFPATYDPAELLDPHNRFAGSRFQLHLRYERERMLGNHVFADTLQEEIDRVGDEVTLVAVQGTDGTHARMTLSTPKDVARGVLLALEHPQAPGNTFGVGPDQSTDLFDFAHRLGEDTGLAVVDVTAPTISNYWTLNARAKEILGFQPRATAESILTEAADAWRSRQLRA